MTNSSKQNHDRPSGTPIIPEDNHIPRTERNSVQTETRTNHPGKGDDNRNSLVLIQTAEDILAGREPAPGPYWPSENPNSPDNTLHMSRWDSFEYNLLSNRGGSYEKAWTDEEVLAIDPDFREKCLLDAIEEILHFARVCLRDDRGEKAFRFENVYLWDEIRAVCRRHLTRLLGRWYELESSRPAESSSFGPTTQVLRGGSR